MAVTASTCSSPARASRRTASHLDAAPTDPGSARDRRSRSSHAASVATTAPTLTATRAGTTSATGPGATACVVIVEISAVAVTTTRIGTQGTCRRPRNDSGRSPTAHATPPTRPTISAPVAATTAATVHEAAMADGVTAAPDPTNRSTSSAPPTPSTIAITAGASDSSTHRPVTRSAPTPTAAPCCSSCRRSRASSTARANRASSPAATPAPASSRIRSAIASASPLARLTSASSPDARPTRNAPMGWFSSARTSLRTSATPAAACCAVASDAPGSSSLSTAHSRSSPMAWPARSAVSTSVTTRYAGSAENSVSLGMRPVRRLHAVDPAGSAGRRSSAATAYSPATVSGTRTGGGVSGGGGRSAS